MSDREYLTEVISERDSLRAEVQDAAGSTASRISGVHDPAAEFTDQHEKNMHILGLIRDEPAWALTRILRCEKLEAALLEIANPADVLYGYANELPEIARKALKP